MMSATADVPEFIAFDGSISGDHTPEMLAAAKRLGYQNRTRESLDGVRDDLISRCPAGWTISIPVFSASPSPEAKDAVLIGTLRVHPRDRRFNIYLHRVAMKDKN